MFHLKYVLSVQVVTLSTQGNTKLLQQLESGFKRDAHQTFVGLVDVFNTSSA